MWELPFFKVRFRVCDVLGISSIRKPGCLITELFKLAQNGILNLLNEALEMAQLGPSNCPFMAYHVSFQVRTALL